MPITWPHTFHDGVGEQASGAQVMDNLNALQPTAWKRISTLGYLNGWVDAEATRALGEYRKLPNGDVEMRGAIKSGPNSSVAFTLPPEYRPANPNIEPTPLVAAGGGLAYLSILSTGNVVPANLVGGNVTTYCHLDCSFSTE